MDCVKRNFQDSVNSCTNRGCTIASFHSDEDVDSVKSIVPCNVYIGAASDGKGNWSYIDGSEWWAYSKNDNLAGVRETKIVMDCLKGCEWHDWGTGDELLGVICQQCPGIYKNR